MANRLSSFILATVILLASGKVMLNRRHAPVSTLDWNTIAENTDDPCMGKDYCIGIYISPWCSHCQATVPFLKQVRERIKTAPTVGMRVIIGHDRPDRLQEMALKVQGTDLFLDTDQSIYRSLGIDSVPRWIVWNSQKKVIGEVKGSVEGAQSPQVVEMFLKDHLKVKL